MSELAEIVAAAIRDHESKRIAAPLAEYIAERVLARYGPTVYGKPYLVLDRAVPELHVGIWPYDLRVCVGPSNAVEIDKLYGPSSAMPLRVELDLDRQQWVVERQVDSDDDSPPGTTTWRECARIHFRDEGD